MKPFINHATKSAKVELSGRNPFINDTPPPIYTAIRLVIPAINFLLSEDERDQLQSTGRIEKSITKKDIIETKIVKSMNPQPVGLANWVEAALEFLTVELNYARKLPDVDPQQYIVVIDNRLIKADPRELFSDRAATNAAKIMRKGRKGKRSNSNTPGQGNLFGGNAPSE